MTRPEDKSDKTHTIDGVEITAGLRVYNYYDCKWGVIDPAQFDRGGSCDPGGEYFQGWYQVTHDDGSTALLNGHRMSTVHPKGETDPRAIPNS